ncbi:hypothetical protein BT69DRAFT_361770 [Atractiella rhizophila]|nr:hypothetical protein BT69DRAFT_361770 [Atractiella rhizophila]
MLTVEVSMRSYPFGPAPWWRRGRCRPKAVKSKLAMQIGTITLNFLLSLLKRGRTRVTWRSPTHFSYNQFIIHFLRPAPSIFDHHLQVVYYPKFFNRICHKVHLPIPCIEEIGCSFLPRLVVSILLLQFRLVSSHLLSSNAFSCEINLIGYASPLCLQSIKPFSLFFIPIRALALTIPSPLELSTFLSTFNFHLVSFSPLHSLGPMTTKLCV